MKYLILMLLPIFAHAGGPHNHTVDISNTTVINVPQTGKVAQNASGAALGIATSQLIFDASTYKTQISAGVGHYEGSDGLAIGVGKRVDNLMLNGSIGWEDGKTAYGAGLNIRF